MRCHDQALGLECGELLAFSPELGHSVAKHMGSSVRASCTCGFSAAYTVGGAMRSHLTHSYFPYRCSPCGIVSVNVAADELLCPRNRAHKLTRIAGSRSERMEREKAEKDASAATQPSFLERIGLRKIKRPPDADPHFRVICQWDDHELYDQPYECPYCRQLTMRFTLAGTRFD